MIALCSFLHVKKAAADFPESPDYTQATFFCFASIVSACVVVQLTSFQNIYRWLEQWSGLVHVLQILKLGHLLLPETGVLAA